MIEQIQKLKVHFDKADKKKTGDITPEEFFTCCEVELNVKISKDTMKQLFEMSDFNHDKSIDFQEFVVVCALVYLLEDKRGSTLHAFAEIYDLVIDAFLYFDKDNSGYLNREEVMEGFQEGATPSAKVSSQRGASSSFSDRFEELDWDKNGQVSFREFLFALEKWIGMDEDDGGDDTPRQKKGSGYFAATSPQQTQQQQQQEEEEEEEEEKEEEEKT